MVLELKIFKYRILDKGVQLLNHLVKINLLKNGLKVGIKQILKILIFKILNKQKFWDGEGLEEILYMMLMVP